MSGFFLITLWSSIFSPCRGNPALTQQESGHK
nr:MAG TPA: protein of unknown function (DUF3333) [Caudoviricetes sp.]